MRGHNSASGLDFESCVDLQSLIVVVIGDYTGMRVKDMHGIL